MNIICDKTLLSAAIDGVSKAVTLRSTIPVLEGILLKAEGFQLTLTGYDLEMGIVTTIDANVKEPGEVVLNAKLLSSMVSRTRCQKVSVPPSRIFASNVSVTPRMSSLFLRRYRIFAGCYSVCGHCLARPRRTSVHALRLYPVIVRRVVRQAAQRYGVYP